MLSGVSTGHSLLPVLQTYNYGKDSYKMGNAYAQVAISTKVRGTGPTIARETERSCLTSSSVLQPCRPGCF
jgi:hypothetical protein